MKTVILAILFLSCVLPSVSLLAQEEVSRPAQWKSDLTADQQESFGYDASIGYRLPVFDSAAMPLFKIPGVYAKVGAGERFFSSSNPSLVETEKATSWHYGLDVRVPLNESLFVSSMTRRVHLRLPKGASARSAQYLESGLGVGIGSAKGMSIEVGQAVRYAESLDTPIQVGGDRIDQRMRLYPTLRVGYQL